MKSRNKQSAAPEGDRDLLAAYRDGDASAFRALVELFRDRMLQFFFRLCWDRDRAEDLTQELFIKLITGSKRYRPEGRMATFVYRVATNLWIDHYRAQRPRPRLVSFDQVVHPEGDRAPMQFAEDAPSPQEQMVDVEERAVLRAALERLTEPHRIVFELAVYQERPYSEVSELLGIPVGTVKSRMHNAVRALKEMLSSGRSDDQDAAGSEGGDVRRTGGAG